MKYILVFLTLIWTLTKAEFDEICKHPTESLESKKAQCRGFESSRKTKLLERRKFIRPRPKFGHRSLNSEKPAVVHLVSLQRRFLKFILQPTSFSLKSPYEDIIESTYFQTTQQGRRNLGAHPQILPCAFKRHVHCQIFRPSTALAYHAQSS